MKLRAARELLELWTERLRDAAAELTLIALVASRWADSCERVADELEGYLRPATPAPPAPVADVVPIKRETPAEIAAAPIERCGKCGAALRPGEHSGDCPLRYY